MVQSTVEGLLITEPLKLSGAFENFQSFDGGFPVTVYDQYDPGSRYVSFAQRRRKRMY